MADYVSILTKAIQALPENNAVNRQLVFVKARAAIEQKLHAVEPAPGEAAIARQLEQLDAAAAKIEAEYAAGGGAALHEADTTAETVAGAEAGGRVDAEPEPVDDQSVTTETQKAVDEAADDTDPSQIASAPDEASSQTEDDFTEAVHVDRDEPVGATVMMPPDSDSAAIGADGAAGAVGSAQANTEAPSQKGAPHTEAPPAGMPPPVAASESADIAPERPRRAGRIIGSIAGLGILGGLAYGGYLYRDQIAETGGQAVEVVRNLLEQPEPPTSREGTGQSESVEDTSSAGGVPDKDENRLGDAPQQSPAVGANSDQANPEPIAETMQPAATPEQQPAVAVVEPQTVGDSTGQGDSGLQGGEQSGEPTGQTPTGDQQVAPVTGENAYLYEEAAGAAGASRDEAVITWNLSMEAPESGLPPEAVIKGSMEVPARGLALSLTIKRNIDEALPASHIIELVFDAPPEFSGGNVYDISRFVMKSSEQARGESLIGVPARIEAGYFLIALNNLEQAQETNRQLLINSEWIDIPISYVTGRRALVTLEKGVTGRDVFQKAIGDWRNR